VIERRPDVTVKCCMATRTTALAILLGRFPIVLEVDRCSPGQPGRRLPLDHGRELMHVIRSPADQCEDGEASVMQRRQVDQRLALVVGNDRLNVQLTDRSKVSPREATLDRRRAVPKLRQLEQALAEQGG
jgi:hypothetical protein